MKKMIKIILPLLAILYIIGILFIPFMEPLRYNLFAWLLFVIYIINTIFIYSLLNNRDKSYEATEQEKKEMVISQELLKERGKWYI